MGPKGIGAVMVVLGRGSRLGKYTVYILIMFWYVGLVYVTGSGIEYAVVPEYLLVSNMKWGLKSNYVLLCYLY